MEDLICKFIVFCKKWCMWKDIVIIADGRKYTDCKPGDIQAGFRGFSDVKVEDASKDDIWDEGQDDGFAVHIRTDGPLAPLLMWDVYEIYLEDASFELKEMITDYKPDVIEEMEMTSEEADECPEKTTGLTPMEFDSYEEYAEFRDEMIHDEYVARIEGLYGLVGFEGDEFVYRIKDEFYDVFYSDGLVPKMYNSSVYFYRKQENVLSMRA